MAEGRYNVAWNRLSGLSAGGGGGEVDYQLGLCELYRGHRAAAMVAWERVPPGTPFAARGRAERHADHGFGPVHAGRGAVAQRAPPPARSREEGAAPRLAAPLPAPGADRGCPAGDRRIVDIGRFPRGRSGAALPPRHGPVPARDDAERPGQGRLERRSGLAGAGEPGDQDRPVRRGGAWLDACLQRRPDDRATWGSRLELAVSSGDADAAWQALAHLPADECSPAESLRLRAWLARQQGDRGAERKALSALIDEEPGDTAGLARLAELALTAGEAAEVDRLRQAGRDDRRQGALSPPAPGRHPGDPAELARLAETLGRRTEARGWALIRDGKAPGRTRSPEPLVLPVSTPDGESDTRRGVRRPPQGGGTAPIARSPRRGHAGVRR